jgi:hypothetical protein
MTAVSAVSTRDARIYRVNAWREMKGRPALTFPERSPEPETLTPGGPEWWTEANTRLWSLQQWGTEDSKTVVSPAQEVWSQPLYGAGSVQKASAACKKPLTAKEMAKWRKSDPRPTPVTFYDGKLDTKRAAL